MCFSIFAGPLNSTRDLRKKTSALKFLFSAIQMEAKCHRLDCQSMENYNKATMVLTLMGKLGLRLLLSFLFILFLQQLLYYYYWSNMDMFEEYEFDFIIILVGKARSKIQKIFFVILIARTYVTRLQYFCKGNTIENHMPLNLKSYLWQACLLLPSLQIWFDIMYNFRFCQLAHCGDIEIILRPPPNKAATIICFSHIKL